MGVVSGNGTLSRLTQSNTLGSTSMNTAVHSNHYPSRSTPTNLSAVVNDKFLKIDLYAGDGGGEGGKIGVISGYTTSTNQNSINLRYINITEAGSVVVRATATYPRIVQGWYDNDSGGSQLVAGNGTSTLDITLTPTTFTTNTEAYARFSFSANLTAVALSAGSTPGVACGAAQNTYYSTGTSSTWFTNHLYTNSSGTTEATTGQYYSDGGNVARYDGNGSWSQHSLCI